LTIRCPDDNAGRLRKWPKPLLRFLSAHRLRQASYAPLLAAGMGIMFLRLLVMAWLLDLAAFAALSAGLIVSSLVTLAACFGLFPHLQRRLPVHLVRGHLRAAGVQMGQTILAALAVALIGLLVAFSNMSAGSISSTAILVGTVHGLAQQLFLIATTESRSNNEPVRYARQHLLRSLLMSAAGIAAALLFGSAEAVLIAEAVVGYAAVLIILAAVRRRFGLPLAKVAPLALRSFKRVNWLSMGTLLIYALISAVIVNLDRWLSAILLSPDDFARYSFAWIVIIAAMSVQALVNASVYPMIARRFALHGARNAFRLTFITSSLLLVLSLLAIGPAVYVVHQAIPRFFPQYAEATSIIAVLAIVAAFKVSEFWSTFLIIGGHERSAVVSLLFGLVAGIALWQFWLLWNPGSGIHLLELAYLPLSLTLTLYIFQFLASVRVIRKSRL